jgi:hypothetical protein
MRLTQTEGITNQTSAMVQLRVIDAGQIDYWS